MTIEDYYREIAPRLTNYLVGGGMEYALACDIVQETFVRLWKRRDEIMDDPAQVSGLIFTIARNLRADWVRKSKRETLQAEITDSDAPDPAHANPFATTAQQEAIEGREINAALRQRILVALTELPPLLRESFTLYQIGGISVREIARQTNVSEALVKVRIHRAKIKLRTLLKDCNPRVAHS